MAATGDQPRPQGPAAQALVWDVWPQTSESALERVASHHENLASSWNNHGDATKTKMYEQRQSLAGTAGDAHQEAMQSHVGYAYDAADYHRGIVNSVRAYRAATVEFKYHLAQLADEAEPVWQQAAASKVPGALEAVYSTYKSQVAEVQALAWGRLAEAPPQPTPPASPKPSSQSGDNSTDDVGKATDPTKKTTNQADTADNSAASDSHKTADEVGRVTAPGDSTTKVADTATKRAPGNHSADDEIGVATSPPPEMTSAMPSQAMHQMPSIGQAAGSGAGSGLGGSGLGSLSSGLRPSTMPAASGAGGLGSPAGLAGAGASPASAVPKLGGSAIGGGGSPGAAGVPLGAAATSNFEAGLSSGMGSPGAVSPMAARSVMPFGAQQVTTAGPVSSAPAGMAMGSAGFAGGTDSAGGVGAAGTSAAPVMGAMPMAAAAGGAAGNAAPQPLAPYNAPGGGAGLGAGSATAPVGGGAQPGALSAGGGQVVSGPTPPVVTGAGSSASIAGLAAAQQDGNPDLTAALRVLADVVRGTHASGELQVISWAVGVLRTPVGPQMVIANSVGGGGYIPARVFLPATAHLAVLDPALPMGWAEQLMGCPSPVRILAAHAEQLSEVVAGVSVSAIATSELYPRRPGISDFAMLATKDILEASGEPPRLDGAHLHRLTVVDPGLARRVAALDRGGEFSMFAAAHVTRAVMEVAFAADETGQPLANREDGEILEAVNAGTADAGRWQAYQAFVRAREGGAVLLPEIHAPQDFDRSAVSVQSRMFYRHFYRMGRVAELVNCWRVRPVSLSELVYCGAAAGAGGQVGAVVTALEQQMAAQNAVAALTT